MVDQSSLTEFDKGLVRRIHARLDEVKARLTERHVATLAATRAVEAVIRAAQEATGGRGLRRADLIKVYDAIERLAQVAQ